MKRIILCIALLGLLSKTVHAEERCIDTEGYWVDGACHENTYSCPSGYSEYEDTCRKVDVDAHWGNWEDGATHSGAEERDVATTYKCPTNNDAYDHNSQGDKVCSKYLHGHTKWADSIADVAGHKEHRHWIDTTYSFTAKVSNGDAYCDQDTWVEPTYKDCPVVDVLGCIDPEAENYNSEANVSDNSCTYKQDDPKDEPKNEPSKPNTFHEDKRCLLAKPPLVTWSSYDSSTETLNWSAEGGDKVELRFGWEKPYQFKVILENDGHEKVGVGTAIGYFFNNFEMRTLNGCKKGDWN